MSLTTDPGIRAGCRGLPLNAECRFDRPMKVKPRGSIFSGALGVWWVGRRPLGRVFAASGLVGDGSG